MATYTYYWPEWACDDARSLGLEGQPVPAFFGGQNADSNFARFKVQPGDTVVAVTVVDGALLLLASLAVEFKGDAEGWLQQHPEHRALRFSWHGGQLLAGTARAPLSFSRAAPAALLEAWRFDSGREGRPLKHLSGGKLSRPLSVQGVYRLTEETATQVLALLAAGTPPVQAPREAPAALEQSLRAKPEDRQLAAVLADRWTEDGDLRGELLTLELALAEAGPGQLPALAARLEALLGRRGVGAVLKQSGGFPFRAMQAERPYVQWTLGWTSVPSRPTPAAVAQALSGWATPMAVTLWTNRRRTSRALSMHEALALQWAAEDDTLEVQFLVRCPGAEVPLPFQRKPFAGAEARLLRLTGAGAFALSCPLPLVGRPEVLREVVTNARAALWPFEPAAATFTLHTWEGRVARRGPWAP